MIDLLQAGFSYIHGRDRHFRPILIINAKLLNEIKFDVDVVFNVSWFICFYIIENLLQREKVENWIDILNLGGLPISKIPVTPLKKFFVEAQENLKSRVSKFYIFNVTWGIRTIYSLLSPFLDQKVKEKFVMKKGEYDESLFELAHPSQIEQKYGGEAENVTQYWPPYCPSEEYDPHPECIDESKENDLQR